MFQYCKIYKENSNFKWWKMKTFHRNKKKIFSILTRKTVFCIRLDVSGRYRHPFPVRWEKLTARGWQWYIWTVIISTNKPIVAEVFRASLLECRPFYIIIIQGYTKIRFCHATPAAKKSNQTLAIHLTGILVSCFTKQTFVWTFSQAFHSDQPFYRT